MIPLLEYLAKVAVSLAVFYSFYWLFLRKDTHFVLNRVILLSSLLLAFFLPFINLNIVQQEPVIPTLNINFDTDSTFTTVTQTKVPPEWNFWKIISVIYLTGAAFVFLRLIYQSIYMQALSRLSKAEKQDDFTLVYMKKDIIPFSYFNKIFIPESVSAEQGLQSIIDHERSHLKQMHFVDLFLVEILTIIQWFNPFAWFYERSVKEVHEYLADRSVLSRGYNKGNYQALLVNQAMGGPVFTIANQFNQSLIKKRIVMMTKMKSPRLAQLKSFLLLPLIAIILMAYNQPEKAVEVLSNLNPEDVVMPASNPSQETVKVQPASIPSSQKPVSNIKAEQIKIVGKVVDSETGKDMAGVFVVIKGTTIGAVTDNAGDFAILVPDNDAVLAFSCVGYNTQLIPVKNNDRMYVKMEESILKINLSGPNSLVATDKPASFEKSPGDTYVAVEELPSYPGGTDALKEFITENLKYPADAKGKIIGVVPVTFIIDREGNMVNSKVEKSLYPSLDEEAMRVVKLIKGWKPAMQNGKPVACKVGILIQFK